MTSIIKTVQSSKSESSKVFPNHQKPLSNHQKSFSFIELLLNHQKRQWRFQTHLCGIFDNYTTHNNQPTIIEDNDTKKSSIKYTNHRKPLSIHRKKFSIIERLLNHRKRQWRFWTHRYSIIDNCTTHNNQPTTIEDDDRQKSPIKLTVTMLFTRSPFLKSFQLYLF